MAWEKRVVWSEGMLLQPQHFQQQARYLETQIRQGTQLCQANVLGILTLEIDPAALQAGKLCLNHAAGILPDASYFNFPEIDNKPAALDINESHLNQLIYLALPMRHYQDHEVPRDNNDSRVYRYATSEHEANDVSGYAASKQHIEVAGLNLCLLTENDDRSEFSCLPIALIDDVSSSGVVKLSNSFIYPTVNIKNVSHIQHFLTELVSLTEHRINELAARVSVAGKATTTEISDLLMLQLLNRNFPIIKHLDKAERIAPRELYLFFIALIGELATFVSPDKTLQEHTEYDHYQLTEVFDELIALLRQSFSFVLEQHSINIPLVEQKYGISTGVIADKTLFSSASFILAITADMPPDEIRQYFPSQVKIGAIEQIKDLVNIQLPGIAINNLSVVPREIPYRRNSVYFELIANGKYWQQLVASTAIAIHVGTNFSGLSMELWAVRSSNG